MNKQQNIKIGLSVALASLLSLGFTGCGGSSDAAPAASSSTVDVTVERGKVYDANVTDSSTPAQVAVQKPGKNVYTFANMPTYPIVVNGGWIDINDDGMMDANDTVLDIEMKSYGTTVTPITTLIADANETVREQKLEALVRKLNESGVGEDTNVTAEDLLKVPSKAPRDVVVVANATFKDMKEKNTTTPDVADIMTQFATIDSALPTNATAVDAEKVVISDLEGQNLVKKVSKQDLFKFEQKQPEATIPPLAEALLKNNITGLDPHELTFHDDYTVTNAFGTREWRVEGNKLVITSDSGDRWEYTFDSTTPTDGSNVSIIGYFGDTTSNMGTATISITAPAVTPPTTGNGNTTGAGNTIPNLSAYSSIIIYKNINQTIADGLLSGFAAQSGFTSENRNASCSDFGFTGTPTETSAAGVTTKSYLETSPIRTCTEADYANAANTGGTANVLAYYGN